MSFTALLLTATVGLPLAMLLACLWQPLRERMLPWLALGAVPGLAAAFLSVRGELLVLGSARFPLAFALDRPGAVLLGVAALLWLAGGWYAAEYQRQAPDRGRFAVCWLMTLSGCLGIFVAADMVSVYLLLALLSVGTTGLVLQTGTPPALRAGAIYIGMALLAESLLLVGFVLIVNSAPGNTLLVADAPAAIVASPWRDAIFALLIAGFGIKVGLVPLHFWIPLAHGAAPVPASALLSGAVVKASVIGLIRFLPLDHSPWAAGAALAAVGLFGALYAVAVGVTQRHPKTVLAYSSVSQLGVIVAIIGMGMASGDPNAGLIAAFYASNHVLSKGALFMAVGVVSATGSRRLWTIMLPAAVLAVGLGGLPLSGGALTKAVAKEVLGDGPSGALATLSAIGTTLLMLHFLRRLRAFAAEDPAATASCGLRRPWLLMAVASLVVPWALFLLSPRYSLPDALAPYALWAALWPIAVGGALAYLLARWQRLPELPEGDVVVALERAGLALSAMAGAACVRLDGALRQWPLASVALLGLALAFAVATLAGR
ncbi:complex I subunit 5 family protein [Dechloromonas sp. H13]|uniref:complex I subunit 5 family protein n=1 Tax=Dechloromonas sp. H13 TaxID=2570193 RepID=UPI0012928C14|nr:proton-conducting transporter membrane subunit [Dechloromonas sp. H13]